MPNLVTIIRRSPILLAAVALVGATGVVASGATTVKTTWFGSSLNHDPANAGSACVPEGSAPAPCTRVGSYYPGTSGRAAATVDGTIILFRVRAEGPTKVRFKLVRVRKVSPDHRTGQAKLVANGPTVNVRGGSTGDGTYPVESFPAHVKVHKGDMLAIDTKRNTVEYCTDGTPGQLTFKPPLTSKTTFRASRAVDGCLLLVQAVVKPG